MEEIDIPLKNLINNVPQIGSLASIVIREQRKSLPITVDKVNVSIDGGLEGDHFSLTKNKKRQITLIQQEHLEAVAKILEKETVSPLHTRRNLVVKGINLFSLKNRQFMIGEVVFEATGYCHPCDRMEENLGPGGYNAMRGHGGITAKVIKDGQIKVGDRVTLKAT